MPSLYIQITTRCNMRCPHCCFSCGAHGQHMSREHMVAVLQLIREDAESMYPTIGGGEPTLHPDCIQFVKWVAEECESQSYGAGAPVVGIVTNGSRTKQAIELAKLAREGTISARLSYDAYHDLSKVDKRVWKAFQAKYDDEIFPEEGEASNEDSRAMNNYEYFITPHGRAIKNGLANHPLFKKDACCCDGLFITPDGTIWQCGCRKAVIGHLDALSAFWSMYHANLNEDGELPCSKKHKLQIPLPEPFQLEMA